MLRAPGCSQPSRHKWHASRPSERGKEKENESHYVVLITHTSIGHTIGPLVSLNFCLNLFISSGVTADCSQSVLGALRDRILGVWLVGVTIATWLVEGVSSTLVQLDKSGNQEVKLLYME